MRLEPRSPVPHSGDEDLYEALVAEPLLDWTLEETSPRPPAPGATQASPLAPVGQPPGSAPAPAAQGGFAAARPVQPTLTPLEWNIKFARDFVEQLVQRRTNGITTRGELASRHLSDTLPRPLLAMSAGAQLPARWTAAPEIARFSLQHCMRFSKKS